MPQEEHHVQTTAKATLSSEERDWLIAGLAWVGMRRWMGGAAAGDQARAWFNAQVDRRFRRCGYHLTPEMKCLEAELCRRVQPEPIFTGAGLPASELGSAAATSPGIGPEA